MTDKKYRRTNSNVRNLAKDLRKTLTPAEHKLWDILRSRRLGGYKFRRQHPIGSYIVDFYCAECHLVIEIDGDSHGAQEKYDTERTKWLTKQGYRVIRFTNQDVLENLEGVAAEMLRFCKEKS